jgi:HPt (histidine-containing phosphotransfer) domain-containing protein
MPPSSAVALKEWAAVCQALAAGRQTILLRKGGIAEGPGGFRPEHAEFWLLPTWFHERPEALKPDDRRFFAAVESPPSADRVPIELFARVIEVHFLNRAESLVPLAGEHVYGEQTVLDRFHYRRPGLWLLMLEVLRAPAAMELATWPELAGCHSWVDLPGPLPTAGLTPVLDPAALAAQVARLRAIIAPADESAAVPVASPASTSPPPASLPAVPASAQAPLDMDAISDRLGGDPVLIERMIALYRQDRQTFLAAARQALAQQDKPALLFAAHRVHGLLCHFNPAPAANVAGQLEQQARQGDFAAAQITIERLAAAIDALDAALDDWLRTV